MKKFGCIHLLIVDTPSMPSISSVDILYNIKKKYINNYEIHYFQTLKYNNIASLIKYYKIMKYLIFNCSNY